jgi:hypothetical protein
MTDVAIDAEAEMNQKRCPEALQSLRHEPVALAGDHRVAP